MSILDLQGLEATSGPELPGGHGGGGGGDISSLSVVNCGVSTVSTIICL